MGTEPACPCSTVHGTVAQSARHAIIFSDQIVDRCRELAVYLKNSPEDLPECLKPCDGFPHLGPMDHAVCSCEFVKNIKLPLIECFLKIAANDFFLMGLSVRNGHLFSPRQSCNAVLAACRVAQACILCNRSPLGCKADTFKNEQRIVKSDFPGEVLRDSI